MIQKTVNVFVKEKRASIFKHIYSEKCYWKKKTYLFLIRKKLLPKRVKFFNSQILIPKIIKGEKNTLPQNQFRCEHGYREKFNTTHKTSKQ